MAPSDLHAVPRLAIMPWSGYNWHPSPATVYQEAACPACATPYVRSFLTYECLPLVEFQLEEGISVAEVGKDQFRYMMMLYLMEPSRHSH